VGSLDQGAGAHVDGETQPVDTLVGDNSSDRLAPGRTMITSPLTAPSVQRETTPHRRLRALVLRVSSVVNQGGEIATIS
jgi:hypothetical protein